MNPALTGIWEHMRDLGLGALAHANRHAAYIDFENSRWPELSVLQAVYAAELLIKARIAQEHPLLIFDQLPRSSQAASGQLDLEDLFRKGRTFQWSELPERVWAATGVSVPGKDRYDEFGRLRNGIQHFAPAPIDDIAAETLQFVFEVVDPFNHECWDLYAVDYDEDYERYLYFVHALTSNGILFLVSPEAAATFAEWDTDWSCVSEAYRREMFLRIQSAGGSVEKPATR